MLFDNPVRGRIRPDARFIPAHPDAIRRPSGKRMPLVTQSFGPSRLKEEPTEDWPGGELNILGDPIPRKEYKNFHRGIDISKGACAGDILAAAPGMVRVSRKNGAGTEIIVIGHGKIAGHRYQTIYGHLSIRIVRVGDSVVTGTVIGTLGGTGDFSTGCHLHFGVRKDGRVVDPWRRLRQHALVDPDTGTPNDPGPIPPQEVTDMPIPATDDEYVAGKITVHVGNPGGAKVRSAPRKGPNGIRTIPGGKQETWLPTCWVVGEDINGSDRWLTHWHDGRWEFTHKVNVMDETPL